MNNDSRGQALIEYLIIVILLLLGLVGVVGYLMSAIGQFYLAVVKIIAAPIP